MVEIGALADEFPRRTVYVGVDGCGAAGKTMFADLIAAVVPRAVVVHIDDFAGPCLPEWDWDRFRNEIVLPLRAGRWAHYQRWDWDRNEGAEWHDIETRQVVVVEGVSATRAEVDVAWDYTVWVEAPREVRLARARARDGAEQMPRWLVDWMPSEERYIAREHPQERVDAIVSGIE